MADSGKRTAGGTAMAEYTPSRRLVGNVYSTVATLGYLSYMGHTS